MAKILYLVHRLPFPPNKGDKVRSYHLLKHLAARHQVYLGTFIDDPADEAYVGQVRALCTELHAARLQPRVAKLKSLRGLLSGEPLTLPYYRDAGLWRWVQSLAARERFDAVVVFSSSMAQYATLLPQVPMLVDFVDVDSRKWSDYAGAHRWPLSQVYRREGRQLLAYERAVAELAHCSFFVTDKEVDLFRSATPGLKARVEPMCNGVDAEFFQPDAGRASPYPDAQPVLVFTGAMDYWPNVDAVRWFAADIFPTLLQRWPELRFYIVGRSPDPAVLGLASERIVVTGTVDDVRPYLQHAAAVVAPLRLARGIQNKVLEAMAMARPVVAARSCVRALDAMDGRDLISAETADDYVSEIGRLLSDKALSASIAAAGRACVLGAYAWSAHLQGIDRYLEVAEVAA